MSIHKIERAPMGSDDIVTHGQTETCTPFLCAEERLKDIVPMTLGNSGTGIMKSDLHTAVQGVCANF